MTSKKTNKFSSEMRARAVRMVFGSRRRACLALGGGASIAAKFGCTARRWMSG